jgi:hypothetical protein
MQVVKWDALYDTLLAFMLIFHYQSVKLRRHCTGCNFFLTQIFSLIVVYAWLKKLQEMSVKIKILFFNYCTREHLVNQVNAIFFIIFVVSQLQQKMQHKMRCFETGCYFLRATLFLNNS